VLEGAPEFGAIGYGIQFGPNVFHVFHRLGLTEAVMSKADCPPAVLMRDAFTGDVVVTIPTGASFRARFKHPYIIIHRIDLHHALLDACRAAPEIELVADTMVTSLEDLGDRSADEHGGGGDPCVSVIHDVSIFEDCRRTAEPTCAGGSPACGGGQASRAWARSAIRSSASSTPTE